MKKMIYTDIHNYSAKTKPTEIFYTNNAVFLNDIFDVHCLKKDATKVEDAIRRHRYTCRSIPSIINVKSNHGGSYEKDIPLIHIENGVLYTHGHFVYAAKAMAKWENKKAGISRAKFFGIYLLGKLRKLKGGKMSKNNLRLLANFAKEHDCHTIVCGHFHKTFDGMYYGTRIVVCNCGRTEIDV